MTTPKDLPETAHQYEWTASTEPSLAVIEAVSDALEIDPLDLEPLGEYVDPDALDALFLEPNSMQGVVSFPFASQFVAVHSDGRIFVYSS